MTGEIEEPTEIGFVGLGSMGEPMARNVLDAGYALRAYNRTEEKAKALGDAGATVARTPREAAAGADAVITMVANADALWDVLTGGNGADGNDVSVDEEENGDGILAGLSEGAIVINMCTVSHGTTTRVADRVEAAGGRFVDSPVSGTVGPAEDGTLTILAAGESDVVETVEPVLSAMGDPVIRCGAVGQGTNAKLFVNLLLGDLMESFAEALAFGDAHDLDPETMLDVVSSGGLDAPLFRIKGESIREGDFEPAFPVRLLSKDLALITAAADEVDVPLPATAATRQAASATRALGYGEEDMAALVKHLETLTGSEVRDAGTDGE